jgi:hypothetical protein
LCLRGMWLLGPPEWPLEREAPFDTTPTIHFAEACCAHGEVERWLLTPLAHRYGNNAVEMETTATWDGKAHEFIINTPSSLAQKYWITNSALHAKWCVVFAQLDINGRREGVHAFLVRIRHDDMSAVNGVRIEDMGHKMGCNGARHLPFCMKCGISNVLALFCLAMLVTQKVRV